MSSSAQAAKRGKVHLFHILSAIFLYTKQNEILALLTPILLLLFQHKKQ